MIKKIIKLLAPPILATLLVFGLAQGAVVTQIYGGGTGTSTAPTKGQLLMGNASGTYDLVATSSLGIVSGTGATTTFNSIYDYGNLTVIGTSTLATTTATSMLADFYLGDGSLLTGISGGLWTVGANGIYYSSTTKAYVGIGTTTPRRKLDIVDNTNAQLRLTHTDNTSYMEFKALSSNDFEMRSSTGYKAMDISDTYSSVYIGPYANAFGGGGIYNVGIGENSRQYNYGNYNVAVGYQSQFRSKGNYNVSLGANALAYVEGDYNIGIGNATALALVDGDYNINIGSGSGYFNVNGSNMLAIGYNSGYYQSGGGDYNTFLGNNTDYIETPNTMIATVAAGGSIDVCSPSYYAYRVTFVVDGIETTASVGYPLTTAHANTSAGNQTINLSSIPVYVGPGNCTARKLYRLKCFNTGFGLTNFYYLDTISGNTTTTYQDTKADASLGAIYSGDPDSSVLLGYGSKAEISNTFVSGSIQAPIYNVYFGTGVYSTSTATTTKLNGTGGNGTDIAGQSLTLAGGVGTGTGLGGSLLFQTATASTTSGVKGNSLITRMIIDSNGYVGIGTSTPPSQVCIYDETATSTLFISSGSLPGEIILKDVVGNNCTRIKTYNGAITSEVATCPVQ